MNVDFTCSCQMKTDLENSADVFSFFEENYSLPAIADNLDTLLPDGRCLSSIIPEENHLGTTEDYGIGKQRIKP